MYYANPDNDPKKIVNINYTKSIDIEQLLLIMLAVFKKNECQFCVENQSIVICPMQKQKTEYENMIDQSKAPYKLITGHNKKNVKFKTTDYNDIHRFNYEDGASNKLYYWNILIESINSRCKVYARHTFIYYMIFGSMG